jgi:hypothetical protein
VANVNLYWGGTDILKTDDAFVAASVTSATINGTTDVQRNGTTLPRGLYARALRTANKTGITTESGVLRLNVTFLANRAYSVVSMGSLSSTLNEAAQVGINLKVDLTGANATTSSTAFSSWVDNTMAGTGQSTYTTEFVYNTAGSNISASILLAARRIAGSGTMGIAGPVTFPEIWIFDVGPSVTQTGVDI